MIVFRRRLFWKIYMTMLASLVSVAFLMGGFWWLIGENTRDHLGALRIRLDEPLVPQRDSPPGAMAAAIGRLGAQMGAYISLYGADGALAASYGPPIALEASGSDLAGRQPRLMRIDLPDGRVLLARPQPPPLGMRLRILSIVIIVTSGVGLAAFPLTARLTRRLEGLRSGVERWGVGALSLRADDSGHDEVAIVARTFNAAAGRVEELMTSQKALLANASHELRSPLARLRMAAELWLADRRPDIQAEIIRNLAEIDQLVDEILLASRLDYAGAAIKWSPRIDLLGLAAEEAARFGAHVAGAPADARPVEIEGDATLLRRLIRNLLENAAKHGRPPIEVAVANDGGGARIIVRDHGPGIAPADRERVFEPFYRPAGRAESAGGWGLGLALVRQIARRHGGGAFYEPQADGGGRFVVELALAPKAA